VANRPPALASRQPTVAKRPPAFASWPSTLADRLPLQASHPPALADLSPGLAGLLPASQERTRALRATHYVHNQMHKEAVLCFSRERIQRGIAGSLGRREEGTCVWRRIAVERRRGVIVEAVRRRETRSPSPVGRQKSVRRQKPRPLTHIPLSSGRRYAPEGCRQLQPSSLRAASYPGPCLTLRH
jgi:hypothetical protein